MYFLPLFFLILCVRADEKVFSFRFVTVFASLYHYAFISREGSSNYKLLRLAASLCSFMTIGQWWYMVSEGGEGRGGEGDRGRHFEGLDPRFRQAAVNGHEYVGEKRVARGGGDLMYRPYVSCGDRGGGLD